MARITPALLVLLLVPVLLSGKRKEPAMLRFHLEATDDDGPKKTTRVVVGTNTFRVRKSQAFDQQDLSGFYPFKAAGGVSFGAAFQLDERATRELSSISEAAQGRRLFTVINTDVIDFVVIDGAIEDGYIVCWKGLTRNHLELIEKSGIPRIRPQVQPGATAPDGGSAPPALPNR